MSAPPLSDKIVRERQCSRDMNWPHGVACGKQPFLHVAWAVDDEGVDAGFVCEDDCDAVTVEAVAEEVLA